MSNDKTRVGRRSFIGGALSAAAGIGASSLLPAGVQAQEGRNQGQNPDDIPGGALGGPPGQEADLPQLFKTEMQVNDCEVEGIIPSELNGAFYRVGPDPQYPLHPGNIPFDGEGHVSMFRISNGRVDYKTRFVKNDRYLAQDEAGELLFPMYRNPAMDAPIVKEKGLSRSTANTHIINHRHMLLALKEDSPPSALDLLTLETLEPSHTFGGQLPSETFTAHPKVDSITGNIVAFGYEAEGFGSDVVSMFEITPQGEMVWNAKINVPYVGLLHDFAVTENHIVFYVMPLAIDHEQMDRGGIHWSWDPSKKTYFGIVRRGGDGSDVRWIEGPTRSATHVMGAFEDNGMIYVDVEMSMSNPFPFMPHRDGSSWDPVAGTSHITRLSANLNGRSVSNYGIEQMYPHTGALPRQDDRYNTMPYRYGFLGTRDPFADNPRQAAAGYARFDHATRTSSFWNAGTSTSLAECCFAPKGPDAAEGEGYLMGLATRQDENGRADLVILDAERLEDGPVATVKLPTRAVGQIHGWWVPESQLPVA